MEEIAACIVFLSVLAAAVWGAISLIAVLSPHLMGIIIFAGIVALIFAGTWAYQAVITAQTDRTERLANMGLIETVQRVRRIESAAPVTRQPVKLHPVPKQLRIERRAS